MPFCPVPNGADSKAVQELRERAAEASHWQRRWQELERQCAVAIDHAVSGLGKHGVTASSPGKEGDALQDICHIMDDVVAKFKVWWLH